MQELQHKASYQDQADGFWNMCFLSEFTEAYFHSQVPTSAPSDIHH